MLDTPCSEVVWRVLAIHYIRQFPFHFPSRASPCAITFQLDSTSQSLWWLPVPRKTHYWPESCAPSTSMSPKDGRGKTAITHQRQPTCTAPIWTGYLSFNFTFARGNYTNGQPQWLTPNNGIMSSYPSRDMGVGVLKALALRCVGTTLAKYLLRSKVNVTLNKP